MTNQQILFLLLGVIAGSVVSIQAVLWIIVYRLTDIHSTLSEIEKNKRKTS